MRGGEAFKPVATLADEYGGKCQISIDDNCYVLRVKKKMNSKIKNILSVIISIIGIFLFLNYVGYIIFNHNKIDTFWNVYSSICIDKVLYTFGPMIPEVLKYFCATIAMIYAIIVSLLFCLVLILPVFLSLIIIFFLPTILKEKIKEKE